MTFQQGGWKVESEGKLRAGLRVHVACWDEWTTGTVVRTGSVLEVLTDTFTGEGRMLVQFRSDNGKAEVWKLVKGE